VTFEEFDKEGAAVRDLIAAFYNEIERLGTRVYELERQIADWREHLI
jgi:hypothetical protein